MFANVNGNLLTLVVVSIHQDPLDEIVAVLIASDVDEWNARTVWTRSGDDAEVAIQKFQTANLEALLNNL